MLNYSKNNVYFCRMKFEDIHNVHEKLHEENASPEALEERCDGAVLHRWRYENECATPPFHLSGLFCMVCKSTLSIVRSLLHVCKSTLSIVRSPLQIIGVR